MTEIPSLLSVDDIQWFENGYLLERHLPPSPLPISAGSEPLLKETPLEYGLLGSSRSTDQFVASKNAMNGHGIEGIIGSSFQRPNLPWMAAISERMISALFFCF